MQSLLSQIRRKQILLCAYQSEADAAESAAATVEELPTVLRMDTDACSALVARLEAKGLLCVLAEPEREVRLTEKGRRLVQRMSRAPRDPVCVADPS